MPKQIACGHCGGTHGSVAEVRACSNGRTPSAGTQPPVARPELRTAGLEDHRPLDRSIVDLAGPERLGRSVLIRPGDEVPAPWKGAPVVRASSEADKATVEELHQMWRLRRRTVIEWSGLAPSSAPSPASPFHELAPDTELPGEHLAFAATANAVDLLQAEPRFTPISYALELGADIGTTGDIRLTTGQEAWADGGPLDRFDPEDVNGLAVVPRVHLVAGRLRPLEIDATASEARLAPDQLAAVEHRGGPARIIAPAGSGKTRVLTERTRYLVENCGVDPVAVSLVAYNRRAREEMNDRLADVGGLDIRTLNSLALAIATGRRPFATSGADRALVTISELDARRILERIVPGKRRRRLTDPLEPWIDALSACRLGLRHPDEVELAYGGDVAGFAEVLPRYREALADRGQLDFDEQILSAIDVLLNDPEARQVARRAAPILLIDEFQDLTPAHLLLVRTLAGPAAEVFAVGDDDQTIYGYSGASPDWLVHFTRFFPGAADHRLTINYRCPPSVVSAATNLLSHNRNRVPKEVAAPPARTADADALSVNPNLDPQRALVTHVEALLSAGAEPQNIAVLARVHAALLPAAVYLAEAGHAVVKPAGVNTHLLDRSGFAAALAWLRLACAPEQRLAADDLRLALRRPPRSLHPRIVDWVCEQGSVKALRALANRLNTERDAQSVKDLAADIESLRKLHDNGTTAAELLDDIYHRIGLLGAASQLDSSQRSARRAAHADELAALRSVAEIGPGPADLEAWLRERLDSLPTFDDSERHDVITLATIHTTKGLEWDHVVVHDVRGDLYPHRLAADTEEERRIFHVALTRCRRSVLINAVPPGAGQPTSPFVTELARARSADEPWPERSSPTRPTPRTGSGSGPKKKRREPASPGEAGRRQSLTAWRTERCRADEVPAYVVIDNATLDAIAEAGPGSLLALGRIKGIGPAKLDRYGADILGVIGDQLD